MPEAPAPYDVVRSVRSRQRASSETGESMKIHHLFVDQKGESHFEDMEIPYVETGRAGRLSARLPATGIIFREVQPDYDLEWHPAPRSMPPMPLTSEHEAPGTWRAPVSPRSWRVASMIGKMPYMPEWV